MNCILYRPIKNSRTLRHYALIMKKQIQSSFSFLVLSYILLFTNQLMAANAFTDEDNQETKLYGVHQVKIAGNREDAETTTFTFEHQNGSKYVVNGFYDGDNHVKARLYCDKIGTWDWYTNPSSNSGSFKVVKSNLKGKLRANGKHFEYDNGDTFIPVIDTGYDLFNTNTTSDSIFEQYLDDAEEYGATVVRITSLGSDSILDNTVHTGSVYFQDVTNVQAKNTNIEDLTLNYQKFQSDDSRIQSILTNHPNMQIQLILLGSFDVHIFDLDDAKVDKILKHMMARYSAYPNIIFLAYNDLHIGKGGIVNKTKMALKSIKKYDKYNTLRSSGFQRILIENKDDYEQPGWIHLNQFNTESEKLMTYMHLETDGDLAAEALDVYYNNKHVTIPVICGEDVYESHRYNDIQSRYHTDTQFDAAYAYRRGNWSWILSGGAFAYAGEWHEPIPYAELEGTLATINGKAEKYNKIVGPYSEENYSGMNDLRYIKKFFKDNNLHLSHYTFNDNFATNGKHDYDKAQAMKSADTYVVYTPINNGITIPNLGDGYKYRWLNPHTGEYTSFFIDAPTSKNFNVNLPKKDGVLFVTKHPSAKLITPTKGKLSAQTTFKWEKNSADKVKLYFWDNDAHERAVPTVESQGTRTTIEFPQNGHHIKLIFTSFYNNEEKKIGPSGYYNYIAGKLPTPTNLSTIDITNDSTTISWQDNSNNEQGYKIYQDGILIKTLPAGSTNYEIKGLKANTQYTFEIKAYDNDGGESDTVSITITTKKKSDDIPITYLILN